MFFGLNDVAFLAAVSAPALDPDAAAYIAAVEAADTQALEQGVRDAINAFVIGCKNDGIWTAIKASCILAGARTLTGALVPLVGAAPTNVNFVSGDYNRKTGLVGNESTKYLDSNRNNNADPQNSYHVATLASTLGTGVFFGGTSGNIAGNTSMSAAVVRCRSANTSAISVTLDGLVGVSRNNSSGYIARFNNANTSVAQASETPVNQNMWFLRQANVYSSHRLAFYSIGEALDLALLDARVTALINAIAAAIP
jgi:hypothetical protein